MAETTDSSTKPGGENRWLARVCGLVTLLGVFIPTIFWGGGVLEGEAISFIHNYADSRPVLQKIFNPYLNDFNMYQARELSYVFDYLDTRFFFFLLRHFDVTFFVPLSAVVSTVLIIMVYRRGVRQTLPGLDRVTSELLLLPFLTCFVTVSTLGIFYRSAKPMLAPVLLALMFHILGTAQSRAREPNLQKHGALVTRQSLFTFALLLVTALLDRQGFFYLLSTCLLLLVHYLITRKLKDLLIASVAAAIAAHLYNVYLGPAIIWAINAQRPDFTFQQIPAAAWAKLPVHCLQAGHLLIANLAALFGGYLLVGYLVLALVSAWLVWRAIIFYKGSEPGKRWEHYKSSQSLAIFYALMIVALHVVMFGVMITRHGYVYQWIDHWYWYYPLTSLVATLFGLAVLLNGVLPNLRTVHRQVLKVALVLIALSNLAHLPRYRTLMTNGPWFSPVYRWSENLKATIRHRNPNLELGPEFKRFLILHEKRRKRAQ